MRRNEYVRCVSGGFIDSRGGAQRPTLAMPHCADGDAREHSSSPAVECGRDGRIHDRRQARAADASIAAFHGGVLHVALRILPLRVSRLGTLMFLPYARVVPMHLTIIFGGMLARDSAFALLLFCSLKTAADVLMHYVEHRVLQRDRSSDRAAQQGESVE